MVLKNDAAQATMAVHMAGLYGSGPPDGPEQFAPGYLGTLRR